MKMLLVVILACFSSSVFSVENRKDAFVKQAPNNSCWCILASAVEYRNFKEDVEGKEIIAFYKENGFSTEFNSAILDPTDEGVVCFAVIDKELKGSKIDKANKNNCMNWSKKGKNIIDKDKNACIKDISTRYLGGTIINDDPVYTFINCKNSEGEATEEELARYKSKR